MKVKQIRGEVNSLNYLCLKIVTIMILLMMIGAANVYSKSDESQQQPVVVTGIIKDTAGEPMPGVSVVAGSGVGTVTDIDGKYSITTPADGSLTISYLGYKQQVIPVRNRTSIEITMEEDTKMIDEVVVVGYGTQRKTTLTGAVSTIKGSEMVVTKNENVQNMLTGKVAGVRVWQRTAEPGRFNNNFDIRGMGAPLIVIDGIPRPMDDFVRLDPNDIEDLSVLKDGSAAIYGIRAANGVVLVTTRKGQMDKAPELTYSGSFIFQKPSGLPNTYSAIEGMTMRNESLMHSIKPANQSHYYSDAEIDAYRNGEKISQDWYKTIFNNFSPQTQHNITVSGGGSKTTYHVGLGYLYQGGFFNTDDINYSKYNLRANIVSNVAKGLTFELNSNAVMDERNTPYEDTWTIFKTYWRTPAMSPAYADPEKTMLFNGLLENENPLAWINSDYCGFRKYNNKWVETAISLKWDIPGVKGLSIKGLVGYDFNNADNTVFQKGYNLYRYDEASESYSEYYRSMDPDNITREQVIKTQLLTQFILNYSGKFDNHDINGTLIYETQQRKGDNYRAKRYLPLPLPYLFAGIPDDQQGTMNFGLNDIYDHANIGFAGRLNYAYANKYLLEFMFRYDGSSKFAPGHQWGLFPSVSAGWRISEEDLFKNSSLSFIQQLKLRGSYGVMGDDGASAYQFISGYTYPASTNNRYMAGGYSFDGSFIKAAANKGVPNMLLTWYESRSFNIGVDMEGWNGLFGFIFDYFDRRREGLLARRNGEVPTVVGAQLPEENLNSDRHFGLELTLSHRNRIGDFFYNTKLMGSITRQERLYVERAPNNTSNANWRNNQNNRIQGVYWGYQHGGQFQSWEEIWNYPVRIGGGTILGDYYIEDWNGDGVISDQDTHPVRYNQTPWVNFSFNLESSYKRFDLNVLFQGSAFGSLVYGEAFLNAVGGYANGMTQFLDRWHPVDPWADPYDPATVWNKGYYAMAGTAITSNSTFNVEDASYLRLKSIELGYTLPNFKLLKNIRVFVNAYNLLTLTKVRDVDPEHTDDSYGYTYPLNKTLSFGLNIKF